MKPPDGMPALNSTLVADIHARVYIKHPSIVGGTGSCMGQNCFPFHSKFVAAAESSEMRLGSNEVTEVSSNDLMQDMGSHLIYAALKILTITLHNWKRKR